MIQIWLLGIGMTYTARQKHDLDVGIGPSRSTTTSDHDFLDTLSGINRFPCIFIRKYLAEMTFINKFSDNFINSVKKKWYLSMRGMYDCPLWLSWWASWPASEFKFVARLSPFNKLPFTVFYCIFMHYFRKTLQFICHSAILVYEFVLDWRGFSTILSIIRVVWSMQRRLFRSLVCNLWQAK